MIGKKKTGECYMVEEISQLVDTDEKDSLKDTKLGQFD